MSELGNKYREAELFVMAQYLTELNKTDQSQIWKIKQIASDRAAGIDSGILHCHALAVEERVNKIESEKPVVSITPKKTVVVNSTKTKQNLPPVTPGPIEPASPPTDTSSHGIDLGWD